MELIETLLFILKVISGLSLLTWLILNGATFSMFFAKHSNPKAASVCFWVVVINIGYMLIAAYATYSSPGVSFELFDVLKLIESVGIATILWLWTKNYSFYAA